MYLSTLDFQSLIADEAETKHNKNAFQPKAHLPLADRKPAVRIWP